MTRHCSFPGPVRATIPGWPPSTRSRFLLPRRRTLNIIYGFGTGTSPLAPEVVLSWTGSQGAFTETLTTVKEVARDPSSPNSIGVTLLGTVTGPPGSGFIDTPVSLTLTANQEGGPGNTITVSFTNASGVAPSIPEPSTWVMMALGFGALGYGGFRRRNANLV